MTGAPNGLHWCCAPASPERFHVPRHRTWLARSTPTFNFASYSVHRRHSRLQEYSQSQGGSVSILLRANATRCSVVCRLRCRLMMSASLAHVGSGAKSGDRGVAALGGFLRRNLQHPWTTYCSRRLSTMQPTRCSSPSHVLFVSRVASALPRWFP